VISVSDDYSSEQESKLHLDDNNATRNENPVTVKIFSGNSLGEVNTVKRYRNCYSAFL